jgi:hypothetical protein
MGTNYYRVPKASEMKKREKKLLERIHYDMNIHDPSQAYQEFRIIKNSNDTWSNMNPWEEFIQDVNVHLGKRSGGWKFVWNFHNNEYYSNKEELLSFIRSGKIVNEYAEVIDQEEFIEMALSWGQPDGLVADKEYFDRSPHHSWMSNPEKYYDREIDGLRVSSSTEFS